MGPDKEWQKKPGERLAERLKKAGAVDAPLARVEKLRPPTITERRLDQDAPEKAIQKDYERQGWTLIYGGNVTEEITELKIRGYEKIEMVYVGSTRKMVSGK